MVVDIYASSIAKTVFMIIALIILFVSWYYTIIGVRILANRNAINNVPVVGKTIVQSTEKGIKAIPGVGTTVTTLIEVTKYGGIIGFCITMVFLIIFESCWKPQKYLKKCNEKVTELIELTELERLSKKYKN